MGKCELYICSKALFCSHSKGRTSDKWSSKGIRKVIELV